MPTCTDIVDALNTLASAATNPNIIDDLSGTTSVLSGLTATVPSPVQLTAGGNAVLSVPPSLTVDGFVFTVIVAGRLHSPTSGTQMTVGLVFGDGTSSTPVLVSAGENSQTTEEFILELRCVWDSTLHSIKGWATNSITSGGSTSWSGINVTSVASQSDIKFSIFGTSSPTFPNSSDPTDSLTITQFKAVLF